MKTDDEVLSTNPNLLKKDILKFSVGTFSLFPTKVDLTTQLSFLDNNPSCILQLEAPLKSCTFKIFQG